MHTRILEKKSEAAWHGAHSSLVYFIDGRRTIMRRLLLLPLLLPLLSLVGLTLINLCYPLSDEVTSAI